MNTHIINFLSIIDRLLKENQLSGRKMLLDLELSLSSLSEWKKGKSKPTLEAIIRIGDYFNVPIDYLLGRDTKQNLTVSEENLIKNYRSLSAQGKEYVLQTMNMAIKTYKKDIELNNYQETRPQKLIAEEKISSRPIVKNKPRHT